MKNKITWLLIIIAIVSCSEKIDQKVHLEPIKLVGTWMLIKGMVI